MSPVLIRLPAVLVAGLLSTKVAAQAADVLPPAYLGLDRFQQCLMEQPRGSYRSWCMPEKRPQACPKTSWKQLRSLQGDQRIPACGVATPLSLVRPPAAGSARVASAAG